MSKVATSRTGPVFRLPCGTCLTGYQFNKFLKATLGKKIDYDHKKILSHSFRAGKVSGAYIIGNLVFCFK